MSVGRTYGSSAKIVGTHLDVRFREAGSQSHWEYKDRRTVWEVCKGTSYHGKK